MKQSLRTIWKRVSNTVKFAIQKWEERRGEIKEMRIIPFSHSLSTSILFPFLFILIFCSTFYSGIITITPRPIVVVASAAVIIVFFSMSIDYRRMRATFYTHLMETLWAKHKPFALVSRSLFFALSFALSIRKYVMV